MIYSGINFVLHDIEKFLWFLDMMMACFDGIWTLFAVLLILLFTSYAAYFSWHMISGKRSDR